MDYRESILDAVGGTPLIRLNAVAAAVRPLILAKLESLNPGGSIKDRIGLPMIEAAEKAGLLRPGGTIVEPTSGNTGHALAMAAAIKGYKLVFVMPDKMSGEKIALLKAYGAEVVISPTNVARESPQSYYSVADRLTREIPGAFQPNQYFNDANPQAHYRTTGPEIWEQTDGRVDVLVAGMGTGGTISGCARYLKERNPRIQVVGADPEGSIYSGEIHPYKVEGIGEDFLPGTMDLDLVDRIVRISDEASFLAGRRLAREEGLLVGASSGTALVAALEVAAEMGPDQVVVVIFPDTGRNYLSRFLSDEWMREQGFGRRPMPTRVREVLSSGAGQRHLLVTVAARASVGEAIDLMQQHGISQLPVTEDGDATLIVGSLQERSLLDRLYRNPGVVGEPVALAMDPPLATVSTEAPVEEVFARLVGGEAAVLAVDGVTPYALVTRADLLEYVAARRNG